MSARASIKAKASSRSRLVLLGNGMATSRLLDALEQRKASERYDISVFGEEPGGAYNRVLLSKVLAGAAPDTLTLKPPSWYAERAIQLRSGVRATRVDLKRRGVFASDGTFTRFDRLVFATGSRAMVPAIPGLYEDDAMLDGVFVFRTLDDCAAIRAAAEVGKPAVVLGGGLLGLEAARGLADLGMRVVVLDRSPGPLARQLDARGQSALAARLTEVGITCRGGVAARAVLGGAAVSGVQLSTGETLECALLILACGIEPRVELARSAGIPVGRGIQVDESMSVPAIAGVHAVGECAERDGQVYGTVAPIWEQVDVLADGLAGIRTKRGFGRAKVYTRLKLAGVDVASLGVVDAESPEDEVVEIAEHRRAIYRKLIVRHDRIVGAQFVGDTTAAPRVVRLWEREEKLPENRLDVLCSEEVFGSPAEPEICSCRCVGRQRIASSVQAGARSVAEIGLATGAGTGCGSCRSAIERIVRELTAGAA